MKRKPSAIVTSCPTQAIMRGVRHHRTKMAVEIGRNVTQGQAALDLIKRGLESVGLIKRK